LREMEISESADLLATNLLTGVTTHWVGRRQYIRLETEAPAMIFTLERLR
jgi:hypothetical protein